MKKIYVVIGIGCLGATALGIVACSSAPKNDRERFERHWKEKGDEVRVLEVRQDRGMVHGSGVVDSRPVDEFYDPKTGQFMANAPTTGVIVRDDGEKMDYKALLGDLAKEAAKPLGDSDRIAVLDFPDEKGRITPLSHDIAERIEAALVDGGHTVVDRAKLDKVMSEHQFQQKEGALFDVSTLARLGKFAGANSVVYGKYLLLGDRQLTVSAKTISVETARVLANKEKEIPLTGDGAENRDRVLNLLKSSD